MEPTDKQMMDFLEHCVMEDGKSLNADRDYNPMVGEPTHGWLDTVRLFTVPSQHVQGVGFRGAVAEAMKKINDRGGS